jgi:hypothetical protein
MRAKTLRTAAAVLVVLGLLAAAAPAAAAPDRADGGIGPALLHQLTAWLAGLWPGTAPAVPDGPAGLAQRLVPVADPGGDSSAGSPAGPTVSSDDDPTAEPELGPRADPDG